MPEKLLKPIVQKASHTRGVEAELWDFLKSTVFGPLLDILEAFHLPYLKENAKEDAVLHALKARKIYYREGVFTGQFNAAISRGLRDMGATHDARSHTFNLAPVKVPLDVRLAATESQMAADRAQRKVLETLNTIEQHLPKAPAGLKLEGPMTGILDNLEKQYKASVAGVAVAPDMSPQVRKLIYDEYTTNLEKTIKKFAMKRIPEIRSKIQQHAMAGGRPDKLAKILMADYGMAKRKAAFVAEQETSLLISKYRESRYKDVGSKRYVWRTSRDSHVRSDHKALHGRTFAWDSPPITNNATGARNNPGEDYGCRCIAIPVLDIQES